MDDPAIDLLERLQRHTEALVAQQLRSVSAVVARLCDAIAQAHAMGHGHAAIHARLRAGGLALSWNNYRAALVRARRHARRRAAGVPTTAAALELQMAVTPVEGAAASAEAPASAPVQLLDALASAQRAASRDYAQVARASGRRTRTSS